MSALPPRTSCRRNTLERVPLDSVSGKGSFEDVSQQVRDDDVAARRSAAHGFANWGLASQRSRRLVLPTRLRVLLGDGEQTPISDAFVLICIYLRRSLGLRKALFKFRLLESYHDLVKNYTLLTTKKTT